MSNLRYPPDLFHLRENEKPLYGEFPELKAAVKFFTGLLSAEEWSARRLAAAKHMYSALAGERTNDKVGKYFDEEDTIGFYLFQGEAFTEHPWNYEVVLGCHIIPVLATIGKSLPLLLKVNGFEQRVRRVLTSEKAQPNGGLFEILTAAAYARDGWTVAFKAETPGIARTYDLDISKSSVRYAVECKRMESGEYVERERSRMRELWLPAGMLLARREQRSTYADIRFKVEIAKVPQRYLAQRVLNFIETHTPSSQLWDDDIASGVIGDLDLSVIQESLKTGYLLFPGPVFTKLLTGSYRRYDSQLGLHRLKFSPSPHWVDDIDLAVIARWSSESQEAIDRRARDIHNKLVEANRQLPGDVPGIIHIGLESLSGDVVERRRFDKIMKRVIEFDPMNSGLAWLFCHYFAPEASPEEVWAMDETVQWMSSGRYPCPIQSKLLLLPNDNFKGREGAHWDGQIPRS